ncbi:MAG TPA: carotenoid biosynthesis protein [Pilimelia sp.]|nr:carotenoid biosynthesis protein [Pilimelia sp.]
MSRRAPWLLLAALVAVQIGYPLTAGRARAGLVVATVVLGYALSVAHAAHTRGARTAVALVAVTTGGGLAVEALGVASGVPFGAYTYTGALGPKLAGVPLVIPLAWTWMAWPAWLAALRIARGTPARVAVAGVGLAAWDLFLDPQMVAERYWTWVDPSPALPGVPDVPVGNYLGWLGVALAMMAVLAVAAGAPEPLPADAPMHALYLWTYASQILAHAVFLGLPASAAWGGLGMGLVAVPLAAALVAARRAQAVRA